MPSKYRAFKEAADRIVELERDLAAAKENLQSADEDRLRMRAQTARLDAALIEKDISIAARDAELAAMKQGKALADGMANMIRGFILKTVERETLDESAAKYRKWEEDYCHSTPAKLDRAIAAEQRAEAAERELELAGYERSSAVEAFNTLSAYLCWKSGGLGSAAIETVRRAQAAERKAEEAARDAEKLTLDAVEQRLLNWRQSTMNKSGDRLALDDFMGKESIDDLVDYVCDEFAAIAAKGEA